MTTGSTKALGGQNPPSVTKLSNHSRTELITRFLEEEHKDTSSGLAQWLRGQGYLLKKKMLQTHVLQGTGFTTNLEGTKLIPDPNSPPELQQQAEWYLSQLQY